MKAANFQMKGTLKEHKNKKDESAEKPDIDRKPIVRCDKLIVHDGKKQDEEIEKDDEREKDDSYYVGCTMPASKGDTGYNQQGGAYRTNKIQ